MPSPVRVKFDDLIENKQSTVTPSAFKKTTVIRFDDLIFSAQVNKAPKTKRMSGAGGGFPLSDEAKERKYGAIKPTSAVIEKIYSVNRWMNVLTKATLGDVPFVRRQLPKSVQKTTPLTPAEKKVSTLAGFGRDIYAYGKIGALVDMLGKLSKIGNIGKYATGFLGKTVKTASEATKGAGLGAVTAGSEDPKTIAKHAGTYGMFTGATVPVMEGVSRIGEKVIEGLGKSEFLNKFATWLSLKLKDTPVNKLVRKRYGEIQSDLIDSEAFINGLEKQLTPETNKNLLFVLEKTKKAQNTEEKRLARKVRRYLDAAHKNMVERYGEDVSFIKDYVPHIWDIPKNKEQQVINWFITRNPHLNKRLIPTVKEGMEKFGLKPKYDKITDVLRVYDQVRAKTAANMKFAKSLSKLKDETGVPALMRADKAPGDWPIIDHYALNRTTGKYIKGKDGVKKLILAKIPVRVNPAFYNEIKAVLDTGNPSVAAKNFETINTLAKQAVLTLSLFHHGALSETGFAAGIGKDVIKAWNPIKIIRAFKNGTYKEVLNRIPLAKRGVKAGLNIGAISDVEGGRSLVNALKQAEKHVKGIGLSIPAKIIRKPLEFNNKFLWDYLHTTYKLTAFEKMAGDMMRMFPNISKDAIDKEVAQFVNDSFGGQAWDILSKSPQWRRLSRVILLSPDWFLSTMRQALAPFGVGATSKLGADVRKELGKEFWRKAIVYFGGGMNLLNYAMTKAYLGEGHFMWENDPGEETYLFWGFNDDGTKKYLRWGKQFRELAEFITDPLGVVARKIGPLLRASKHQLWPDTQWQRDIIENTVSFRDPVRFGVTLGKELAARGKQLLKDVTPYSISQQQRLKWSTPVGFIMPVKKGMTPYRARKGFKEAILNKDKKLAERYYKAAFANGLDGDTLFKQALSEIKSNITYKDKKEAKEIIAKLRKLGPEKGKVVYEKMVMNNEISPGVQKQIKKIILLKKIVSQKKKRKQ